MPLNESKYLNKSGTSGVSPNQQLFGLLQSQYPNSFDEIMKLIEVGIQDTEAIEGDPKGSFKAEDYMKADLFDMTEAAPLTKLGYSAGDLMGKGMGKLFGDKEGNVGLGYGEGEWAPGKGLIGLIKLAKDKLFGSKGDKSVDMEEQAQEALVKKAETAQVTADAEEGGGDVPYSGLQGNEEAEYGKNGEFSNPNSKAFSSDKRTFGFFDTPELPPSNPDSPFYDTITDSEERSQEALAGGSISHEDRVANILRLPTKEHQEILDNPEAYAEYTGYDDTQTSEEPAPGDSISHEDEINYLLGLPSEELQMIMDNPEAYAEYTKGGANLGGLFNKLNRLPTLKNMSNYLTNLKKK